MTKKNGDYSIKIISVAGKWNALGLYKSNERAKEVLQEIIDTYLGFPREKNNPLYLETRLALQGMVNNFITVPKIYYMPKE